MYALHSCFATHCKVCRVKRTLRICNCMVHWKTFWHLFTLKKFLSLAECVYLNLWTSFHELVKSKISLSPISDGFALYLWHLTHWGRVTHICVADLTIIDSDNGLSPERCQAIISNNAGILLIGHLWTNFSEISVQIHTFSFKKMHLKTSPAKWQPFCHGLNMLTHGGQNKV